MYTKFFQQQDTNFSKDVKDKELIILYNKINNMTYYDL